MEVIVLKELIPVYYDSIHYALDHNETEKYRASFLENVACRDAIDKAIFDHYRDNRLNVAAAQDVVKQFGYERTLYILALTIQHKDQDGRFSRENKEWAKTYPMRHDPGSLSGYRYIVDRSHPGLVDLFLTQVRCEYAKEQEHKPSIRKGLKQNAEHVTAGKKPARQKEPEL